ncbi:EAL domain-containing protein [Phorcysia thermohydrogeniphila]|uniref:Diguanylate cyclase (GGDEF)-like protein n=1 Tax=Phorcysia thermohydrogeniphila TaxID=936138 RepID=A0A4R1GI54_9BACT|nr:EAL domain-containing protein [Phorcysia thermohydrogeniphila]TCK06545.1 diguanylate cyclase (GGDEF)-like protein [Phorcysia thermohydrogeniphila]
MAESFTRLKEVRRIGYLLLLILVASVLFMAGSNYLFRKEVEEAIYVSIFEQNKKRLKEIVDATVLSFSKKEALLKEDMKRKVREEVLNAHKIATSIYRTCKILKCSDNKIKRLIHEALKGYRFFEGKGYIFIDSVKGPVVLNPLFPELEGKNVWNIKDAKGKLVHREFERTVLYSPNNEGFVTYYWYLPGTKKVDEKISFLKLFKPYNWIIGGGFYLSDFKEYVKRILKEEGRIYNLFIVDLNGKTGSSLQERRLLAVVRRLPQKELESGLFINNGSGVYYLRLYRRWNWLIGSYVTKDDLFKEAVVLKGEFMGTMKAALFVGSLVVLVIFSSSTLGIWYFMEELRKTLRELFKRNRQLTKLNREMVLRAYKDNITGLRNRNRFEEDLRKVATSKVNFALVNIRNFREINELFGMKEGDRILRTFGKFLKRLAKRENKFARVYRIRGDRFGLLVTDISEGDFISMVKRIIAKLEQQEFEVGDIKFRLDVVAGISRNREQPIIEAEIAEQEAKKRNMDIYVFDVDLEELYRELQKNITIATKLKDAISNDRVIPVFQPIVDLQTGEVEKYEALMRIVDEDGKLLMPGDFLPVAKKISIYNKLSKKLIEKALLTVREKGIKVALNISSEDLVSSTMRDWLIEVIRNYGVADKVCFEIVESEAFSDLRILESFYSKVKELGAELAIDDFGSGYSNYEYITIIKPDYIKIDGSLISKVVQSKDAETLVKHIVLFSKELNIKTVAEFISSEEILEKVKELGVDYGQGFYLGKPTQLS